MIVQDLVDTRGWQTPISCFTKLVFQREVARNFVIIAEESDTGSPSLVAVSMEYLGGKHVRWTKERLSC